VQEEEEEEEEENGALTLATITSSTFWSDLGPAVSYDAVGDLPAHPDPTRAWHGLKFRLSLDPRRT